MSNYDEKLFVNYEKKVGGFQKLLRPDIAKAVMVIEADKDMGKSWFVSKVQRHCQHEAQLPAATINFGDALEIYRIEDYLDLIRLLRDRLNQPDYFNQLNATINQFTDPDLSDNTSSLATLRRNIETYFSLEELEDLVFEVGVRYDNIGGDNTIRAKTRELVIYCDRNGLMEKLLLALEQERPSVPINWREGFGTATAVPLSPDPNTAVTDKRGRIQSLSQREREHAEQQINLVFFDCLNRLTADRAPIVFLFDAVEKAPPRATDWMRGELLPRMRQGELTNAKVLITGRKTFDMTDLQITNLLVETSLPPLADDHVDEYVFQRRGINRNSYELSFFVDASGGIPGLLAIMADNIARKSQDDDDDFFSDV